MSDEINKIIQSIRDFYKLDNALKYYLDRHKAQTLLDYITNLQQAFENSYTEEQLDFAVNEVKEQLKAEHQLTNQLHNEIDKLRVKNYELQQEKEDYKSRVEKAIEELFELKDMIYKPETREENFPIQRKISKIIINLGDKD